MGNKTPTDFQKQAATLTKDAAARSRESRRRANPEVSTEALHAAFEGLEALEVLDRRLENPSSPTVLPIRLVDEPTELQDPHGKKRRWYLHWFNTSIPNRFHSAVASLGYTPVLWEELQNREIVANAFDGSPQVRRGDRGVEVLCKIPLPYYLAIKKKQQAARARTTTPRAMRDEALAAAAKAGLDGEMDPSIGGVVGDIKLGRERLVSAED
jgi:hypothetical protein